MKIPTLLSEEEKLEVVRRYLEEKHSMARLARDFSVAVSTVHSLLMKNGVEIRGRAAARHLVDLRDHKAYKPTPAQIKKACKEIQKGWSKQERKSRLVVPNPHAAVQVIHELGSERGGYSIGHGKD